MEVRADAIKPAHLYYIYVVVLRQDNDMKVTTVQLHCIRRLLTKEDRKEIAGQVSMSERTVEAVLNGDRANDEIERAIVGMAKQKIAKIARVLAVIDMQNLLPVSAEDLKVYRDSPAWQSDDFYPRYNDVYIRLCSHKWEIGELWHVLKQNYKDVLLHGMYCCDLICRLIGIADKEGIEFYNDKIG